LLETECRRQSLQPSRGLPGVAELFDGEGVVAHPRAEHPITPGSRNKVRFSHRAVEPEGGGDRIRPWPGRLVLDWGAGAVQHTSSLALPGRDILAGARIGRWKRCCPEALVLETIARSGVLPEPVVVVGWPSLVATKR